jgi:hypothetical protein
LRRVIRACWWLLVGLGPQKDRSGRETDRRGIAALVAWGGHRPSG